MANAMKVDDEGPTPWSTGQRRQVSDPGLWTIDLLGPDAAGRAEVESYLAAAYARAFDGRIRRHYPMLVSVKDSAGALRAGVGYRFAEHEPLFLEQYLDDNVETVLARAFRRPTARSRIAEIGNLAADSHAASSALFAALANHLLAQDRHYAVATATRQLRRRFRRVGLETQTLTRAAPERLASGAAEWGGYYARDPEVLAGAIKPSTSLLARTPLARGGDGAQ